MRETTFFPPSRGKKRAPKSEQKNPVGLELNFGNFPPFRPPPQTVFFRSRGVGRETYPLQSSKVTQISTKEIEMCKFSKFPEKNLEKKYLPPKFRANFKSYQLKKTPFFLETGRLCVRNRKKIEKNSKNFEKKSKKNRKISKKIVKFRVLIGMVLTQIFNFSVENLTEFLESFLKKNQNFLKKIANSAESATPRNRTKVRIRGGPRAAFASLFFFAGIKFQNFRCVNEIS